MKKYTVFVTVKKLDHLCCHHQCTFVCEHDIDTTSNTAVPELHYFLS